MNTMLDDLLEACRAVPETASGIVNSRWQSFHVHYGDSGHKLGVGGQNRGRCPFVRLFRGDRTYNAQTASSRGGTVESNFVVEVVVRKQKAQSQKDHWQQAFDIFEEIRDYLRDTNNYRVGGEQIEQLQVSPTLFVLRINFQVENSY